tara:strand:- start:517 stop:888 length:372 start_codon:yes stop_codon:yes gene_type:complete
LENKLIFIYDGECPFCNQFAELLELKSNIPNIIIKDARDKPIEIPKGYDIDTNGALLVNGEDLLSGASAINFICAQIENPSDPLLNILSIVFNSRKRAVFIFPFLLILRRTTLFFKGVSRKIL